MLRQMCLKKQLCMVNVRGEARVNMHELNAMHVCEDALHGDCVWRSYGECA